MDQISLTDFEKVLSRLPGLPGVYRYFDTSGQCLYVGKARDLKKRVSSYFKKGDLSPRIALMVSKIAGIETTVVRSEAEALLLENNLIKTLNPKYNILFRDDKSYPYLKLTAGDFPRVCYYRGGVDKKSRFFGPYPNANAVRVAIGILQRVFRLRTCEEAVFRNRSRACLMGQMGRCSAPCVGMISKEAYRLDCENACRFLRGETQDIIETMRKEMLEQSETWHFEEAAVLRDKIAALSDIMHEQAVETTGGDVDADIIAVAVRDGVACVNLAMVRGGRHLGDHSFFPVMPKTESDVSGLKSEVLEAFVGQHYEVMTIPTVVITAASEEPEEISRFLSELSGRKVACVSEPQLTRRKWLEMCETGAQIALERRLSEMGGEARRIRNLIEVLGIVLDDSEPLHIECFDISHTSGEATQASCVVFMGEKMDSSRYRRFNLNDITDGDDYAAMREVLLRRYSPVARGEAKLPTVVLVDGGRGQVHMASDVFTELGLPLSHICGVAKGEGRKTGLETLIFADGREPLTLGAQSPALMLIAMIRDEAHRFAITGMREKRSKTRSRSQIQDIEGVGPKRRQKLLTHFGGFRNLKNASAEDIAKIEGISKALAQRIYSQLHGVDSGHSSS